jgi:hypothetical protein
MSTKEREYQKRKGDLVLACNCRKMRAEIKKRVTARARTICRRRVGPSS